MKVWCTDTCICIPPLLQVPTVTTDDFVNFATDKPEKKSRVINLSQYGPTYFGPEHAQVLLNLYEPICRRGFPSL